MPTHPQFPAPHADIALLDNVIEVGGHLWGTCELLEWMKARIQPFGFPLQPVQPLRPSCFHFFASLPVFLDPVYSATLHPEDLVDLQTRRFFTPSWSLKRRGKKTFCIYISFHLWEYSLCRHRLFNIYHAVILIGLKSSQFSIRIQSV